MHDSTVTELVASLAAGIELSIANDGCLDDMTLAGYLDQKISNTSRTAVERHIVECSRCRKKLVELYRVSRQEPEPVPTDLMAACKALVVN